MILVGWKEGKMVATVSHSGVEQGHRVPEPSDREMGAHDERAEPDRPDVGEDVLNRVGVDRDDAGWSSPLVMDLVNVLVEFWMMKEPASVRGGGGNELRWSRSNSARRAAR